MLKKGIVISLALLIGCMFFTNISFAAVSVGWPICTVEGTQAKSDGGLFLCVSEVNGAFENTWISLKKEMANMGLATALTAITLDAKVRLKVTKVGNGFQIDVVRLCNTDASCQ